MECGIFLHNRSPFLFHLFSGADWADNKDDCSPTNAFVLFLGHNHISWSSKKQDSIARSSMEDGYRSIATTNPEICWIQSLLYELRIPLSHALITHCDYVGVT